MIGPVEIGNMVGEAVGVGMVISLLACVAVVLCLGQFGGQLA
jgi:hypothetical protein